MHASSSSDNGPASDVHVEISIPPSTGGPSNADGPLQLTIDEVLQHAVGEFGPSQVLQFVFLGFSFAVEAFHTFVMIFADRTPPWRCTSPSGSDDVHGATLSALLQHNGSHALLHLPSALHALECTPSSNICDLRPDQWEWEGGPGTSTIASFGLICGQEWKVGFVQSLFFVGYLFGAGMFGALSDGALGRKGSLLMTSATSALFGFLTAASPSYWVYATCRVLNGFGSGGIGLISFVLGSEVIGPSVRGGVGLVPMYFFAGGIMTLPFVAYVVPTWRWLYVISTTPTLLFCLAAMPILKESPRWLLVHGKQVEATAVLQRFARENRRGGLPAGIVLVTEPPPPAPPPPQQEEESDPDQSLKTSLIPKVPKTEAGQAVDIFLHPTTRKRILILIFMWFTCAMVYYGLSLIAGSLGAGLYLSTFVSGLIEIPAYIAASILLQRVGRRATAVGGILVSGICCLVVAAIPSPADPGQPNFSLSMTGQVQRLRDLSHLNGLAGLGFLHEGLRRGVAWSEDGVAPVLRLLLSCFGKFGITTSYASAYVYGAELFPTVVRNAALGTTTQAAQIGGILAPQVVVLGKTFPSFSFVIFGTLALIAAGLTLGLPETVNQSMMETMNGVEDSVAPCLEQQGRNLAASQARADSLRRLLSKCYRV